MADGRYWRIRLLAPPLALAALLMLPWSGLAAPQDPLTVVQHLQAAVNAGDLDAAMALFADNATIRYAPPGYGPPHNCCTGKAAVRMAYSNLVAGKGHFTPLTPYQVNGDTVSARIRQTGPGVQASGLQFIDADVTFTVQNGLVVAQTVAFTQETIAAGFRGIGKTPGLPNTGGGGMTWYDRWKWEPLLAGLGALGGLILIGIGARRRRAGD